MYYEHVFEPGEDGRCDHPVSRSNPDFDHRYQHTASEACADCGETWEHTSHAPRIMARCKAERNSVLHDPEHPEDGQRTHWCEALDEGRDCIHGE